MENKERIEIPLNKSRLALMVIGAIAFVMVSLWLIVYRPTIGNPVFDNLIVKYPLAIISVLFFGLLMIYLVKKLTDKRPGITIENNGVFDNTSGVSVGLVPWTDITHISMIKVMNQQFVVISVSNPDHYINKQTNFLKKKGVQYNYSRYGSPVCITMSSLKCKPDQLLFMLLEKFRKNKANQAI
jgi:flagellar biogenesis protein FliO